MSARHFQQSWGNSESYSQSVRVGDLIVTCGQLGADAGGDAVPFEMQARVALQRMVASVRAAGGELEDIVKVNTYVRSLDDFPEFDVIYREVISVNPKPARTTVEVARFPEPLSIEVDCLAVVSR